MKKILIESIAQALSKDPMSLSSLELRKLCILIDWTMAFETYQHGNTFTPLLSNKIGISDERLGKLSFQLISAIQADGFAELDLLKPDSEQMDDMFQRLGVFLGYSQPIIDDMLSGTGFISDYEKQIQKQGLIYTEYLQYKKHLTANELKTIEQFFIKLAQDYPWLGNQEIACYNQNTATIEINTHLLLPETLSIADSVIFILDVLKTLTNIDKQYRFRTSEISMQFLNSRLEALLPNIDTKVTPLILFNNIEMSLIEVIKQSKDWFINRELCAHLAQLITHLPILRGWKTLKHYSHSQPIHRIILMGFEDVTDEEVTLTVNVMLNNHPSENIAITYTPDDVYTANSINQQLGHFPLTLQVIGHGTQQQDNEFTANLGSFRGNAVTTGTQVAQLVNACSDIHHVRLSCCFSGQVDQQRLAAIPMYEKHRPENTEDCESRRTLTLANNGVLTRDNSPFEMKTAAISCWNGIDKSKRQISMTVSPGIIEPDEKLGRMLWKPSIEDLAVGVKEIRITTEQGPKYLPLWQAQSKSPESLEGNTLDYRSNKNNTPFNPFSI